MDEWTADAFIANREEDIPAIKVERTATPSDDKKSDPISGEPAVLHESHAESNRGKPTKGPSLQDRVFTKLLQQVIPVDEYGSGASGSSMASTHTERPGFSLPTMTYNFRRFNARIGVVFVFQEKVERLLSWQRYSHTLSLLAVYSFMCLYPFMVAVLPFCALLFFVFVPAYLARHPPPPTSATSNPNQTQLSSSYHHPPDSLSGPPLAPARIIKPAPELSRDFFHNMRDLQNAMHDFSVIHDLVLDAVTPLSNFSREALSSTLFALLTCLTCALFLAAPLLPWRHLALAGGWAAIGLGHPKAQTLLAQFTGGKLGDRARQSQRWLEDWAAADVTLSEPPELLEVEIFELQRRKGGSSTREDEATAEENDPFTSDNIDLDSMTGTSAGSTSSSHIPRRLRGSFSSQTTASSAAAAEWEPWLFSPNAWEPQAPARVAGARPRGARFFEDVAPPLGWTWAGKKWELDLGSAEWVEGRLLGGLEVEVEGERWVYDMSEARRAVYRLQRGADRGSGAAGTGGSAAASKGKVKGHAASGSVVESGESALGEGHAGVGRGEWRRRRWVRVVKRKKVVGEAGARVLHTGPG